VLYHLLLQPHEPTNQSNMHRLGVDDRMKIFRLIETHDDTVMHTVSASLHDDTIVNTIMHTVSASLHDDTVMHTVSASLL